MVHPSRPSLPALLAAGVILGGLLLSSPADSQVHRFEYDGFAIELRELFTARCDAAWVGIEVVIENTGGARIEPTIAISTTLPGTQFTRTVEWSTVVSPGTLAAPAVRRELVPVSCLASGEWFTFLGADLAVALDGATLEPKRRPPGELQLAREQHWAYGSSLARNDAVRWYSWGNFHTLVVAAGDEPEGWRAALSSELTASLRTSGNSDEEVVFRALAAEALPVHPEAYEGIDRVVLIGLSPDRLSEPQRAALRAAVRLGLRVWLIPDAGGAGNEWVWPPELRALASRPLAIPSEDGAQPATSPGASRPHFLAGEAEPGRIRDTIAIDGEEVPLSVIYPEGAGAWLRATSPVGPWRFREAPEEAWSGRVLAEWLAEGETHNTYGQPVQRTSETEWVDRVDASLRRTVDPRALLIFVVVYLLVAGPGLFIWLKRRGRLPRLLWMQPLVVGVFLAGTGLLGWVHFGVASRSDETYVLYLREGEPGGRLLRLTSLYASVSAHRDLAAGAGTLPIPVPNSARNLPLHWRLDGGERGLEDFRTRTWSLTHFASGVGLDAGVVRVRDAGESFEIENGLPFTLRSISFPGPNDPRREGTVPSGQNVRFELELSELYSVDRTKEGAWDQVRRTLWGWPGPRSDLGVRCVAEFDPADLPAGLFPGRAEDARGYLVLLSAERRGR